MLFISTEHRHGVIFKNQAKMYNLFQGEHNNRAGARKRPRKRHATLCRFCTFYQMILLLDVPAMKDDHVCRSKGGESD